MKPFEFMAKATVALQQYDLRGDRLDLARAEVWAQVALHIAQGGSTHSAIRTLSTTSREVVRQWATGDTSADMNAQRARDEIIGQLHYS